MSRRTKASLYRKLIFDQRKWIEDCEANGKSYTGPNGPAIAQADIDELRRLEAKSPKVKKQ